MLQLLSKADKRLRAERILAATTRALHVAFLAFIRDASVVPKPIMELIEHRDINAVLEYVDLHVAAFGNALFRINVESPHHQALRLSPAT